MPELIDICLVLGEIRPEAYYGWLGSRVLGQGGEDYTNLDWRDKEQTIPTMQEIENSWAAVQQKYFTDVDTAKTDKEILITDLRAGTVDAARLQTTLADILENR